MRVRLGDDIDDFCVKCKRVMNHVVVSMMGDEPAKVRCKTCYGDHDFRHEQAPPPKVDPRKAALFNQVLENMGRTPAEPEVPAATEEPAAEDIAESGKVIEITKAPKGRRKAKA